MKVADFEGNGPQAAYSVVEPKKSAPLPPMDAVPSYDVPYMILYNQLKDANTTEERLQILHEMQAELKAQSIITSRVESIVGEVTTNPHSSWSSKSRGRPKNNTSATNKPSTNTSKHA